MGHTTSSQTLAGGSSFAAANPVGGVWASERRQSFPPAMGCRKACARCHPEEVGQFTRTWHCTIFGAVRLCLVRLTYPVSEYRRASLRGRGIGRALLLLPPAACKLAPLSVSARRPRGVLAGNATGSALLLLKSTRWWYPDIGSVFDSAWPKLIWQVMCYQSPTVRL